MEYVNENFSNIPKRQVQEHKLLRCGIYSFHGGLAALLLRFIACHPGQYPSESEVSRLDFSISVSFSGLSVSSEFCRLQGSVLIFLELALVSQPLNKTLFPGVTLQPMFKSGHLLGFDA